jgi:hypothetical protein
MADKKPADSQSAAPKGGSMPDNDKIPLHRRLAMGQSPKTGADSGPKTPA